MEFFGTTKSFFWSPGDWGSILPLGVEEGGGGQEREAAALPAEGGGGPGLGLLPHGGPGGDGSAGVVAHTYCRPLSMVASGLEWPPGGGSRCW